MSEMFDSPVETSPDKSKNRYGNAAAISMLVSLAFGFLLFRWSIWYWPDAITDIIFALVGLGGLVAIIMGIRGIAVSSRDEATNWGLSLFSALFGFTIVVICFFLLWLVNAFSNFHDG